MTKTLLFLSLFFSFSCTAASDQDFVVYYDEIQGPEIITEFMFEVGSGDNFFFGSIDDVKILSGGKITVLDSQSLSIHILSEEGEPVNSVLLHGRGPGEVQNLTDGLRITEHDYLSIYDYLMFKISIFQSAEGDLKHIRDVALDSSIGTFFLNTSNQLVLKKSSPAYSEDPVESIVVMEANGGERKKTVREFPVHGQLNYSFSTGQMNIEINETTEYHTRNEFCSIERQLFHIRTDSVGFTLYDLIDGERISSAHLNLPAERLTTAEKEKRVDEILASGRGFLGESEKARLMSEMPEFKPLVKTVICDLPDGIWMELMNNNEENAEWVFFSETGEIKGVLQKETGGRIVSIHRGKIFVTETSDIGDITLFVYRYFFEADF